MPKPLFIGIDFDGTCVEHDYPRLGEEIHGCVDVLRKLVAHHHRLILYTMRDGKELQDAEDWFRERGIPLFGVNANPAWGTTSPKVYCHLYIDDAALNIPLIYPCPVKYKAQGTLIQSQPNSILVDNDKPSGRRPYVNWLAVDKLLKEKRLYK